MKRNSFVHLLLHCNTAPGGDSTDDMGTMGIPTHVKGRTGKIVYGCSRELEEDELFSDRRTTCGEENYIQRRTLTYSTKPPESLQHYATL